jgi:outer membrane protein TolC
MITTRVDDILAKPIDVEDAVQIALLNNKSLQSSLYDLGIAESDIVQAGRLPNPKFSMFYARNHGDYKIEQALTFNIFSLVTMPKVLEIERQHFEKTKQDVALNVLRLAYQTRVAYFNAVSANQQLDYSLQVKNSAEASAELATRMKRAGNWNHLELAREQGFFADAVLGVLEAKNQQVRAHQWLSRLLGVPVDKIKLQKRLPDLPKTTVELMAFEQGAFEQRLDLQAMRLETQNLAKRLGLTKVTRFINVFEIGPARVLEGRRGGDYKKGVDLSFDLPLFDWGGAKVARAEASYMQAVNLTAQMLIDAQSEISTAHNHYLVSYEIAKQYRDEIVPLRKKVLDENQLRYNGMLVSPFELFSSARAQVDSVNTYIKKLHAFWLAEVGLQMSMVASVSLIEGNE